MAGRDLIPVDEAARRLEVNPGTVEWLVRSGRLADHEGPRRFLGRARLVEAAGVDAIRGAALERLHGCDTACIPSFEPQWPMHGLYDRCLENCVTTGYRAGWYRWARRLGWRLAGGDPARFPGPRGSTPGGRSWAAWLGCLLPIAAVALLGALGALALWLL
ncbi:MAG: hypothetical protein AVDCRST_MAG19-1417 [uncultured Thermomicrobiales bacterium]|uniref:Uncharacterized protein n=1 Tax=uncultured Thermomicrobiales bacterium TaxID=1645740 RepID=A0A6J4UUB2_9BACT|nr:MAG: hypothetical protein AVDCRST_MAG19-1417 [uncultured Thermomicrobiales bacterium]